MRRIEEWRIYGIVEREEFMLEYLMCLRIWIYFGNLIIIEVRRMNVRKFKNSEVIKVLFSIRMLVFWEISHNSKHYWFEKLKNFTMQFDFSFWKSKNKNKKYSECLNWNGKSVIISKGFVISFVLWNLIVVRHQSQFKNKKRALLLTLRYCSYNYRVYRGSLQCVHSNKSYFFFFHNITDTSCSW